MTTLVIHALAWIHDQVEQTITGAATPLRRPPSVPLSDDDDDVPDIIDAEWREGS